jgi:hypothetical protein
VIFWGFRAETRGSVVAALKLTVFAGRYNIRPQMINVREYITTTTTTTTRDRPAR